ncbi:EscU/YscU/HrcU family type III secretion system export apparatus switch protein [Pantoea sp. SORGH_AS_0659]|uniref:EscU/YscU/HrcU family type III secretion system export apparatus switch protein n=1 Tax=Pantoea sp. SORGH_AS_0659 TaxID=3062597 RepID=UPI0028582E97|nr:EscU/YscU/HrcU family type III secretion system export apparatus switch protein [Pantoea sp. SORGH_AS_0659]MDR6352528.1 type III secretion YscU/HrpY family protein [Pantoea sp. SORGH_AS_0659]
MAGNKTEKATTKKKRDAAKDGQTFKSKDLITSCLLLLVIPVIVNAVSLNDLQLIFTNIIAHQYNIAPHEYAISCLLYGLKILAPVLAMGIIATVVPGIIQTGAQLATKALKLKFDSLNPVKGIKKIFNLRTVKELIKALLYLISFSVATLLFWDKHHGTIISLIHAHPVYEYAVWSQLLQSLLMLFLACIFIIILFDCLCEMLLYLKELKMDKEEVKKERKESDGNPEIKSKRKELHNEILNDEVKENVRKSKVIIANPTHIAVGIYIDMDVCIVPFISVMEKDGRAQAVKRYAMKIGVPVVEDISLARAIFHTHRKYSFISMEYFIRVMDLLVWLEAVEVNWLTAEADQNKPTDEQALKQSEEGNANDQKSDERSL